VTGRSRLVKNVDVLSKIGLFSLLDPADLENMAMSLQGASYRRGAVIIKEGDEDFRLFIVVRGEVDIVKAYGDKKEKHLHVFGPYSYFGEMSLIDGLKRSASAVAKTDVEVLSINQWDLRQEIRKNPDIAFELLKMLSWRARAMNKIIQKTLGNMAPICVNCNRICERDNVWTSIESYINDHSEMEISHSICPECSETLFPQFYEME
jgi:CRP-like cAMP-binding protein